MKLNKYNENYKKVTALSDSGKITKNEYVYIGNYYRLDAGKKNVQLVKAEMAVLAVFIFVIYFSIGFINNAGSHKFYIILPFVISFLPIMFLIIATIQLVLKRGDLNEFDFEKVWLRIKYTCLANIVSFSLSVAGELIFIILQLGNISSGKELSFLFGAILIIILLFAILQIHKQLQCTRIENIDVV